MRRVWGLAVVALLVGGCALDAYDPGLPPVRPEGPAATTLENKPSSEAARLHLAWMMAYQANGHFKGYTDAEKVFASQTRASGVICRNDRDTRMQITYPDGLAGMPVHRLQVSCPTAYKGWPETKEFGGVGKPELRDAAEALGMSCLETGSLSTCRVAASSKTQGPASPTLVARSATLTIDPEGRIEVVVNGFDGQP